MPDMVQEKIEEILGSPKVMKTTSRAEVFDLNWLPEAQDWAMRLARLNAVADVAAVWNELVALSNNRTDFVRTGRLDRRFLHYFGEGPPPGSAVKVARLAILGSSTISHLAPSLRIGALRRGFWLKVYACGYGQYLQDLSDSTSDLHILRPTTILFSFDAEHLVREIDSTMSAIDARAALHRTIAHVRNCWRIAREAFHCTIFQQTPLPVFRALLGNNEHRLPGSRNRMISKLNEAMRIAADEDGVDILSLEERVIQDGLSRWTDTGMWHLAKQEISSAAAPLYGDIVARLMAAQQGRSYKCLVLDLDETLWGGVVGDDGIEGIILGPGSALGEAFARFQRYALELRQRGIVLAVCSKNDEAIALEVFDSHPEMILRRKDIACFIANWNDKPSNLRSIAHQLNIGLESMVFVDDSPFERNLVRMELPMVAVPEIGDDPALRADCLADAGYFESLAITEEDHVRTDLYHANAAREVLQAEALDLNSYLRDLRMELVWRRFDSVATLRIVQLINKTNQFNLTNRRYDEAGILAVMNDPDSFGIQFRLIDRFGDNGIIAIVIGRRMDGNDVLLDTWVMSCRVLGRRVEEAVLSVVAAESRNRGAHQLVGEFYPTGKNAIVANHYLQLGFIPRSISQECQRSVLNLGSFRIPNLAMSTRQA